MGNLNKLQKVIASMTYSEMMTLAAWFADADKDGDAAIDDPQFWAYIINDFSENVDIEEDTQ